MGCSWNRCTYCMMYRDADQAFRVKPWDTVAADLAEAPGEVVGWTGVTPVSSRACYAGVGETSVYVADGLRGRGVGRALVHRQVTEADAAGLWTLQTSIFPENRASLALHRSAGYVTLAVRSRIAQLDGEAGFAEIFFEDVFVPDADVLGGVGDGWRVAMSTAGNERGLSLRSPGRFTAAVDRLIALHGSAHRGQVTDRVIDAWVRAQADRLYTWGTVTRLAAGGDMGAAGSVNKVWWSELDVALHVTALDILGAEAEVESPWLDGYTFSLSGPIYAGTNEIQRNIVAERILGLPREPKGSQQPREPKGSQK